MSKLEGKVALVTGASKGIGAEIAALRESQKGVVQVCVDHGPIFRAVAEAAPLDR